MRQLVTFSHWTPAKSYTTLHNPSVKNQIDFCQLPLHKGALGATAPVQQPGKNQFTFFSAQKVRHRVVTDFFI